MPPLPPPPLETAAASQPALLEQVQQLTEVSPRLAFEKAQQLRDPLLRDRLRRDAFIAMSRTQPKDAASLLNEVIDAPWLPAVHFAQALDIAEFTVRTQPENSKKLLTVTAVRHPAAALRELRQYIDLPYGRAIRDAAKLVAAEPDPELALLQLRQNPNSSLPANEVLRLAARATTDAERETARALLRHINWQTAAAPPATLRAALALQAETGVALSAPAAVIRAALTDFDSAEDPIAEAAKIANILAVSPPNFEDALPKSALGQLLRTYRQTKPNATLLLADLFPDGLCLQRYIFHNDDDGIESFNSFLSAYATEPNWKTERTEQFVHLTSRPAANGRRIEIYANVPATQSAVDAIFKERTPTVIVHRGHDHHFPATRKLLRSEARLVFLGSCNGMSNVEAVVTRCPRAQLIATRGVGTTSVNDTFLRALNRQLLDGGATLNWDTFWHTLQPALGSNEHFQSYVPPHKNEAARFLAAWYREALSAP